MKIKPLYISLSIVIIFAACARHIKPDANRHPLVEVEGNILYADEVQSVIPTGTLKKDSTIIAENYIKKWIANTLLYTNSIRNITNMDEIDTLVENYRRSLIINSYQQALAEERVQQPDDSSIQRYYNEHAVDLVLTQPIMQGILIKLPVSASNIEKVKRNMQKLDDKSVEFLEKYCMGKAVSYDYFLDNWITYEQLVKSFPINSSGNATVLSAAKNSVQEVRDSSYIYFLKLKAYIPEGEPAPLEFVKNRVKSILYNQQKKEYIKQLSVQLYDDAVQRKEIKYFTKP